MEVIWQSLFLFVRQGEIKTIQVELTGREISIVFDGRTRLGEALVVLVRFFDGEWTIQQRLIRFLWLAKSLKGAERRLLGR